ncbi:MAG: amidohydrolase [Ignavibacteria bacterium]|nr:amidohydrolase [Ignavibacteria bacterium]
MEDNKFNYIFESAKNLFEEVRELRRHFHQYPELSHQEFQTVKDISNYLERLNIKCEMPKRNALIAHIGDISGKCIALRADTDALPITEETGYEFASKNKGVMHACGHDFHISMLLAAAKILKSIEKELSGCVKLIFQPAEEKLPSGAKMLIDDGLIDNPAPQAVFSQHLMPHIETGVIGICPGPIFASADELYWTIHGKGSHAGTPHLSNNPITAAADLIINLKSSIKLLQNPIQSNVLSITAINGGYVTNAIPDFVELKGTLRTFNNKIRYDIHKELKAKSQIICDLHETQCELNILEGFPPVTNNDFLAKLVEEIVVSNMDAKYFEKTERLMLSEDFSFFSEKYPSALWFLGVKPKGAENFPFLHSSNFIPDEAALLNGTFMLAAMAYACLSD